MVAGERHLGPVPVAQPPLDEVRRLDQADLGTSCQRWSVLLRHLFPHAEYVALDAPDVETVTLESLVARLNA